MLRFLPAPILGPVTFLLIVLNTVVTCVPFFTVVFAKLLVPVEQWRDRCSAVLVAIAERWIANNNAILRATQRLEWDVEGVEDLDRDASYLVVANHQSWSDILVLQKVFLGEIPFLRFFLKKELIRVPVMGLCWWALDFPFMQRYSKETLEKHPELRGKDLEATRLACEKFRKVPVSILNFLEGTRFTKEKHAKQGSPYTHLLRPKTGGMAFVIAAMGDRVRSIVDVTIAYPNGTPTFWDLMSGRASKIVVRAREIMIPGGFLEGDYQGDAAFRERFQEWVGDLWQRKDREIELLLA